MSEKTEAPTPRKLHEAREEGTVCRSQELNAAAALLIGAWLFSGVGKRLMADMQGVMVTSITNLPTSEVPGKWLVENFFYNLQQVSGGVSQLVLTMMVTGVVVTVAQTGLLFAKKRIGFDIKKLNPLNGFKRFLSKNGLMEWVKALLKLIVIGWVAYSYLKDQAALLLGLNQVDFLIALSDWANIAITLVFRVGSAYLILAAADYAYQRYTYKKSMMMSKEEVKEDIKRSEGDPKIKGRIRNQMRRIARMRMMANVHKADVVITNPTHLAVALHYDTETMEAPKLLAKGAHLIAERIVEIAKDNHIPVIQNIPLARAIYHTVEVDQEVPPELYVVMAEVLAHVYALRGKVPALATS